MILIIIRINMIMGINMIEDIIDKKIKDINMMEETQENIILTILGIMEEDIQEDKL